MEERSGKNLEEMHGSVDHIVFRNEDTGWTVMEVDTEDGPQKVVGELPSVAAGETVALRGRFVEHPSFGRQFRAETCERHLPTDTSAMVRYLASGAVKGVGPSTALRIVEKFGEQTFQIMEKEPQRLSDVKGISPQKAQDIGEAFASHFELREIMLAFAGYGLTPSEAVRCYRKWGARAVETIRQNPYLLCSGGMRISFERADAMAQELHCASDDPRRVAAGILYVLRHNTANGHTCLPQHKLIPTAAEMLRVDEQTVASQLTALELRLDIRRLSSPEEIYWSLPPYYRAEKTIARCLSALAEREPTPREGVEERLKELEKQSGIVYEQAQREAILRAVRGGVLILTGGPGTGKTTTLKGILALLESYGERVLLCAPTGRAAKRISELTGTEAKTIHRLLEVQWGEEEDLVFARHAHNPLEADAVVVDELSMVDVLLFQSLLDALPAKCRLILVGDADQLPAVGAGRVLGDLLESGKIPTVQLTRVFRQALESHIVASAHLIVAGKYPSLAYQDGDFFFLRRDDIPSVANTVEDLCVRRLPERYGYTLHEGIQILCPSRKGELGTASLNARLQSLVNPSKQKKAELTVNGVVLRTGDKVMHTRNNYEITWTKDDGEMGNGVFNGDIGRLEEVDSREGTLRVRYDDRVAFYDREDASDLELAYAVTVHKSQGSEFDAVVLPLCAVPPLLCYRQLLYTAVTRARKLLILVGRTDVLHRMVDNYRKTLRYTGLKIMLCGEKP